MPCLSTIQCCKTIADDLLLAVQVKQMSDLAIAQEIPAVRGPSSPWAQEQVIAQEIPAVHGVVSSFDKGQHRTAEFVDSAEVEQVIVQEIPAVQVGDPSFERVQQRTVAQFTDVVEQQIPDVQVEMRTSSFSVFFRTSPKKVRSPSAVKTRRCTRTRSRRLCQPVAQSSLEDTMVMDVPMAPGVLLVDEEDVLFIFNDQLWVAEFHEDNNQLCYWLRQGGDRKF